MAGTAMAYGSAHVWDLGVLFTNTDKPSRMYTKMSDYMVNVSG